MCDVCVMCVSQKQDAGEVLMDVVFDHLAVQQRQLFCLQLRDTSAAIAANTHSPVSKEHGQSYTHTHTHAVSCERHIHTHTLCHVRRP